MPVYVQHEVLGKISDVFNADALWQAPGMSLFARQPLVHFGFADQSAVEHAALWLRTHPSAFALVPAAELERCFVAGKARQLGSTSRAEWLIVGADADNGRCEPTAPARAYRFSWGSDAL